MQLSYRTRLILGICLLVFFTGAAATLLAHRSARTNTTVLADQLFREVSSHAVTRTRDFVMRAPPLVESLAEIGSRGLVIPTNSAATHSDNLAHQFMPILESNPGISWISYSNRNGDFTGVYRTSEGTLRVNQSQIVNSQTRRVEHEVAADGTWKLYRRDADTGYDPRLRPFYFKAAAQHRTVWIEPYIFYEQGVPGISCARAMYNEAGQLMGVLSVDFDLNALSSFISELSISPNSRVFLFTSDGTMLAYSGKRLKTISGQRMAGKLLTLADFSDPLLDAYRRNLKSASTRPAGADSFASFDFTHDGAEYFASASTFRVGDDLVWVVGAVAPKNDFLGGVWRSQWLSLGVATVALLVAIFLAIGMARKISQPVLALMNVMRRVGSGDLSARAKLSGSPEFEHLSDALNRMIGDLDDRLRLRHSMQLAMDVQQRLLPPGPPRLDRLDIAGHSTYCDETGGDYYDFLLIGQPPDQKLLLAIGDVTGHGIAAALIMSGARAVLRDRIDSSPQLPQLMSRLNTLLASDFGGRQLMTMHLSMLDPQTGMFSWANAGHDPALIYDPVADNFKELEEGSVPLGVLPNGQYEQYCFGPLHPGQVIMIGTDGVWEMRNSAGEQFGKQRLREVIRASSAKPAGEIARELLTTLAGFRGDTRCADDVTFVIVKYLPERENS
jgi:sigma-B regulation protein RsbU (phosphoserine phosphatase)